jgi:hypothetical protein
LSDSESLREELSLDPDANPVVPMRHGTGKLDSDSACLSLCLFRKPGVAVHDRPSCVQVAPLGVEGVRQADADRSLVVFALDEDEHLAAVDHASNRNVHVSLSIRPLDPLT